MVSAEVMGLAAKGVADFIMEQRSMRVATAGATEAVAVAVMESLVAIKPSICVEFVAETIAA